MSLVTAKREAKQLQKAQMLLWKASISIHKSGLPDTSGEVRQLAQQIERLLQRTGMYALLK